MEYYHEPVMVEEVTESLVPDDGAGGLYIDCTVGGGGHTLALFRKLKGEAHVVAIDKDDEALNATRIRLQDYKDRVEFVKADFCRIKSVAEKRGIRRATGILFDLGVSSHQVDTPERGFSYQQKGPLDMRMDRSQGLTAADIVNTWNSEKLAVLIRRYGEERWADRIARFIDQARRKEKITSTEQLVGIIKAAIPAAARRKGRHPAKRTFQALRIAVNNELENLGRVIGDAVDLLRPGGRLCVISFHSLEDRIVKHTLRDLEAGCVCPPDFPVCVCGRSSQVKVLTGKPITPGRDEIRRNPRARSARLRCAQRLDIKGE